MVIQELNPELLVPMAVFYCILRGLDTIEDDMTIPIERKEPVLRDFHNILQQDGWTYHENGPDEKDAVMLQEFNVVITEFKQLKPAYQAIILDITERMENGMADNAVKVARDELSINTVAEYERYCHHVAGIVGEGCTRLFVEAGLANPALLRRADLHESMGQFLQQTNIIRDIHEDTLDKRRFWPKAIWSKYVDNYEDLCKPENRDAALRCSSEMILNAIQRVPDCMFYMAGLKDQSVFNFCAIPQAMAIATLELCFRNGAMFERNVKITKGQACQLMLDSSQNLQILYEVFRKFARKIHKKNDPRDPNFLKVSVACGKVCSIFRSLPSCPHPDTKPYFLPTDRTIHRNPLPNPRPQSHHPRRQRRHRPRNRLRTPQAHPRRPRRSHEQGALLHGSRIHGRYTVCWWTDAGDCVVHGREV